MTSTDVKSLVFLTLLLMLGPLIEMLVRTVFPSRMGSHQISRTGFALGAVLVIIAILYKLFADLHPSQTSSPVGSTQALADVLTIFSAILGVIAVVLTILTGLSITGAWRAIDDAEKALKKTEQLIHDNEKMAMDSMRLAAYVEAIDRLGSLRGVPHKQLELAFRAELASAFGRKDLAAVLDYLGDIKSNTDLICEIGDQGVRFLEAAASAQSLSLRQKSALHAVLAILQSRNRS